MNGYDYVLNEILKIPSDLEELLISLNSYKHRDYKFKNILFLGTGGGSRAAFDLLYSYFFDKSPYPIIIHQGYEIPNFVNEDTLVFSVSYSGDTEETISSTKKAIEKTRNIVIITKGGFLEKLALENDFPIFKLKDGYEARHCLHLIFFTILKILSLYLKIDVDFEIKSTIDILKKIKDKEFEEVKVLVDKIKGNIPVIYGSYLFSDSIAERFRRQLNENGKTISHSNIIPPMHHDEIVGFMDKELSKKIHIILIRDLNEDEKIKKRFEITKSVLNDFQFSFSEIYPEKSDSKIARMFSIIFKLDLVSINFAKVRDFDPRDVNIIDKLKEYMKK